MSDYQPSESKWWWKDYDYDHRDYSYSKGSGSRSWMSKIGYDSDWWKPKKDKNEVYQDLLNQLQNSANLIGDEDRGSISVQWSDGQSINNINSKDNVVYLSPDNLITTNGGGSEISEEILDAMTGKVYLASALRETVSPDSFHESIVSRRIANNDAFSQEERSIQSSALAVWEAMETSIARKKIMEDWAGFGPYIASDAERSTANKQQVQDYIDGSVVKPNAAAASLAIAWNLLNANDPVTIPDVYNDCVDSAVEILENEIEPEDRFSSCKEISDRIHRILKSKEDGGKDGDENEDNGGSVENGEGDIESEGDSKEGEGDGDNGDSKDGDGPSNDGAPKVCDGTLLGDKVENKTDATLSEQQAGDAEDGDAGEISAKAPDRLCELGKDLKVVKVVPESDDRRYYSETVLKNRAEIRSVQSSLQFRSNVANLQSFGHRSGDIDENSLYKVGMNDDRVMMKTDVISSKKIAICILVDESGSMAAGSRGMARYESAREVAVVLAESLKPIDGIEVSIYGHSAEEYCGDHHHGVVIREYLTPRQRDASSLMQIAARDQNHDSWAILHTANLFNKDYGDYDRKIMFVVSDGEPAGSNYGGKMAQDHMLQVCNACEKSRVEVYGIGVDNAFAPVTGERMYGKDRFVILNDVKSSLGVMTRFIRQIAMK
jgi:hypothetical protein